jgi:GNAT superfamily N-acetyltransferase
MKDDLIIRRLEANNSDLKMLHDHCQFHEKESGKNGDIIFTPVQENEDVQDFEIFSQRIVSGLSLPVTNPKWCRYWILTNERQVLGDLSLCSAIPFKSSVHRSLLMMGIQKPVRGLGFGKKMLGKAIQWVAEKPSIEVIDLNVFASNKPAIHLYQSFHFKVQHRIEDRFRLGGEKICDIHMSLIMNKITP